MKLDSNTRLQRIVGASAVAAVAAVAGYSLHDSAIAQGTAPVASANLAPPASTAPPVVQTAAVQGAASMQTAFSQVAHSAEPAVVTITVSARQHPMASRGNMRRFFSAPGQGGGADPLDEFMRRFRGMMPDDSSPDGFTPNGYPGSASKAAKSLFHPIQTPAPRFGGNSDVGPLVETGLGSGFIYDKSGLILTNAHVVKGADRVTVKLLDGREFKDAKVLGIDERSDVAVVKIPATDVPTVTLGDSGKVDVGDWAIAVGNPFGLSNTLTVGVISATAREVPLSEGATNDYLQTDASINPGNSGGPLLDIYGRVVGINNAIYSKTDSSIGIGFAIPINVAKEVADEIVKDGHVRRASIGIRMSDVDHTNAAAYGLPENTKGAIVQQVLPNSPASRAGLQIGDVITAWNGEPIGRSADLQRKVTASAIGKTDTLRVLRNGQSTDITVTTIEMKTNTPPQLHPASATPQAAPAPDTIGVALAPLDEQARARFDIPASMKSGVLVANVQPGSPAERAGIQPGDIIQRVGQEPVSTAAEVTRAKEHLLRNESGDSKSVALYVQRNGENGYDGGYVVVQISD